MHNSVGVESHGLSGKAQLRNLEVILWWRWRLKTTLSEVEGKLVVTTMQKCNGFLPFSKVSIELASKAGNATPLYPQYCSNAIRHLKKEPGQIRIYNIFLKNPIYLALRFLFFSLLFIHSTTVYWDTLHDFRVSQRPLFSWNLQYSGVNEINAWYDKVIFARQ